MQSRGLLIGVVALAALSGLLWWSDKKANDEAKNPAKDSKSVKLLSVAASDVVDVVVQHKNESAVHLVKNVAANKWELVSEPKFLIENDAAMTLATNAGTVSSDKLIDDNATDFIQYGLDPAQITLELQDKGGKIHKLLIGDETPVGNLFYVRLPNEKKVYTIPNYTKTGFDKSANDLRDKRLLIVDDAKLSKLELVKKAETLEFSKSAKSIWQMVKPKAYRTDTVVVDGLYNKAREAKLDSALSEELKKTYATQFASAPVLATLKATDTAGTQQIEVRKSKENLYLAKSSSVPGIYKVADELGAVLDKSLDGYRTRKLLDFGFEDPTRIQILAGGKASLLEHKGEDWLLNGKKLDAATVTPLIEGLRSLSALNFVESGFTTAIFEATVTQSDGKSIEKIMVSKTGNFRYAKREGDAAEYEIDPKALSDLEAALGGLKEPGAVKKK